MRPLPHSQVGTSGSQCPMCAHQYIVMMEAFMVCTKGAEALWAQPTMGRGQIKTSVIIAVLCICVYIKLSVHMTGQS